jgi:glycosyltransferase involved in cell wall biosynthesis
VRIFQILEFNKFNTGSVHQMFQAASGLRERGHEVTIISRPDPIFEEKSHAEDIAFHGLALRNQFDLASIIGLRRLVRTFRPDVIHVHKGVAHAIALAATLRDPVGAFVVNRGVSFPLDVWNRGKYRTDRVDRIVTVCQQIKDVIVESAKLPPQKVDVVYAGTDVGVFDPEKVDRRAFRREKQIPDDRFLIGQVGVRDWKGWKELIDSFSDVTRKYPRAHLMLIGCRDESEEQEVRDYALRRAVPWNVTAVEYRTDMPTVFASCDLVVDASWAGTGITGTIREAMAMRKPVIATDAGGNRELVSSPNVGWLIPMKDRRALTTAMHEVIENRERASNVANNARRHVVNGFSKELRITRLERLYGSILESKQRSASAE